VVLFRPPDELELRPRAVFVPDELLLPEDELLLRLRDLVAPGDAPLAAADRFFVPVVVPVVRFLVVVAVFVVFARLLLRAVELPPLRPPVREGSLFSAFPLPEPDFFPPPSDAFTVAHARRSASFSPTPRFS
jgi:hypothetical protein